MALSRETRGRLVAHGMAETTSPVMRRVRQRSRLPWRAIRAALLLAIGFAVAKLLE